MHCLISDEGDIDDNGTERKETKAPLSPFSPSCFWLSPGIVKLSASLQSTHLEREANPILPAGTQPLAPLIFSPWLPLFFPHLISGHISSPQCCLQY